jgi:hypothetical protein
MKTSTVDPSLKLWSGTGSNPFTLLKNTKKWPEVFEF